MHELEDLIGNRDGLWRNESQPAGAAPSKPVGSLRREAMEQALGVALSGKDEPAILSRFVAVGEEHWAAPVTEQDLATLPRGWHFSVTKALLLSRLDRHPSTIRDTFVRARGPLRGVALPESEVGVRWFASTTTESGCCVVVVPGYAVPETTLLDTIVGLNARGHDVACLLHPATHGPGPSRGLELVRDVAAVVEAVAGAVGPDKVGVVAASVGAGVGLLGALVLAETGELETHTIPAGLPAVLVSPWTGTHWWSLLSSASAEPVEPGAWDEKLHRPDPAALVLDDPKARMRATQLSLLSDLTVPVDYLARLSSDTGEVLARLADLPTRHRPVHVLHADADPLVDSEWVRSVSLAAGFSVETVEGQTHLLELHGPTADRVVSLMDARLTQANVPVSPPVELHGASRDRTLRFAVLAERSARGASVLPEDAREYLYLVVPGLYTERYPFYMNDIFARMTAEGLDHRMVPIDTDQGVQRNAEDIRQTILSETEGGRRVVLIGHSKGGVDFASALALYPELRPKVRAVLTLQAPWLGTPIADLIDNQGILGRAHRLVVEGPFQGDARGLLDLRMNARAEFVESHPWPEEVPAVCLATSLKAWTSALSVTNALLAADHGPTDGFVPVRYALLPGCDAVLLREIDHGGPVLPSPIGTSAHLASGDLIVALLTLALERA